jgi:hypothetical protein
MQTKLHDLSRDERLVLAASALIGKGSCAVAKPVRAGFTTSAIMACEEKGWRLLVLAPTNRILKETVSKASGTAIRVPGNNECHQLQAAIIKNPVLKQLPLPLPDCDKCTLSKRCPVLEIIRVKDFNTAGLTYAKLEALMLSRSERSNKILDKLKRAEVVLMDEAHILSLPSATSVKAYVKLKIPSGFRALSRVHDTWLTLCQSQGTIIQNLMSKAAQGHASQYLAQPVHNPQELTWQRLKSAWGQLRDLAISQETISKDTIMKLRDIINILGSEEITLNYISEDEGRSGSIYISSGQNRLNRTLSRFLQVRAKKAKHIYVSGTIIEAYKGHLTEISGQEVKSAIFPDIRNATKKMILIPDRWKLTSWNFDKMLPRIMSTIKAIAEREKQPIYLLASSVQNAKILKEEVDKLGTMDITVDYYRSDRSMGVERSERVCISVGMAEIPANACDVIAKGNNPDERWLHSRKLRRQSVDTATWQAVNRVRDPEGKVESRVYFIGCRDEQVRQVATWGTDRQIVVKKIKKTRGSNGKTIRTPIMDVEVDQPIETPRIIAEDKNKGRRSRHSVSDYVVTVYPGNYINFQKPASSSTNVYRANGREVEIYNYSSDESQVDQTTGALCSWFVNRSDCYAVQKQNSKTGKWEYHTVKAPITEDLVRRHIGGGVTIGVYQINLDD